MRHTRIRTTVIALALLPAAALSLAAAPGTPDAPEYFAEDVAGDANGLNGQGLQDQDGTDTGPAQLADADLLAARITSTGTRVAADGGETVTLETVSFRTKLGAEPTAASAPAIHRFAGTVNGCQMWVQANLGGGDEPTASVRMFDSCPGIATDATGTLSGSETIRGEGLAWSWDADLSEMVVTIDLATVDARIAQVVTGGSRYALDDLTVRGDTGIATVPLIDEAFGRSRYSFGDDIVLG